MLQTKLGLNLDPGQGSGFESSTRPQYLPAIDNNGMGLNIFHCRLYRCMDDVV